MKNTIIPQCKSRIGSLWLLLLSFILASPLSACSDDAADVSIPDNWLTLAADPLNFSYEGGEEKRDYSLAAGIDLDKVQVSLSSSGNDWLTVGMEGGKLTVTCEHSYVEKERTSVLKLAYDDAHKMSITIKQGAAPSSADALIPVVGGTADTEEAGSKDADGNPLTFDMSYDGNPKTYFNSKFGAVTYPFHLTYELEDGHTLNSIVYTPRQDSGNKWGSFDEFTVEVSTADAPDEFTQVGSYQRGNGVHTAYTMKMAQGIANVKKVRFTVTKAYEDRVSVGEMEFFEASSHKFDLSTIFADGMGTKLREGVTEKQIKQIPNEYLKSLGLALLAGAYDTNYRLADYRPYQHPSVMAAVNKTAKYSLRDNPTGIYAKAGETLAVWVGDVYEGGKISMLIQDLTGGYNNSKTYELSEGYNEVTVGVGGLIYIMNHVEDDIPLLTEEATEEQKKNIAAKTVTVHFGAGKVNGYFDLSKHTESDWAAIRDNAPYQDIDVLGKYSHITWSVADFKSYNTEIVRSIENTDKLVLLEQDFMGLKKYGKMFNNRMHFCIDYKAASPNASDYRTVYNASNYYAEPFCNPDRFAARCWGPAHEVGHCNQTRPGLKWSGLTEVTNNIMSLHVQTSFGESCKLYVDSCSPTDENGDKLGTFSDIYEAATALIIEGKRAHCLPNIKNIVRETQLVPFWQLKLYFMDALGQKDFYRDLYEYFRTHESPSDRGENQGMNQLDFVRQVCALSGYNMLDFFEKWGFLTPVETSLNDYGTKAFTITQEQVDALVEEINAQGYKAPKPNVHRITEGNVSSYK